MYLLDANAFIEASRLYYGFDIAPGFWSWLGAEELDGKVGSVGAVKHEVTVGTGELATWATAIPSAFWAPDTDDVLSAMTELATWSADPSNQYRQEAVDEFLASADLNLIAHAKASGSTLVTREQPAPESKKKIKIPDVCRAFGVTWTDPFSAYRALGLRLGA